MRIGVAGLGGRMGRLVAEEAVAAGALLAGGVARGAPGGGATLQGKLFASLSDLAAACDVVVDFTHADAAADHARWLRDAGVAWVLGTTGLTPDAQREVERTAGAVPVVQAANFSPGVTLLLALAARLARALPAAEYDAEILEMHHRQKLDSPSGTALAIGRAVAEGRGVAFEAARLAAREGQTGARPDGGIGFAALRGGQVVGEHTLLFAAEGEHIALTHKALDRRVFARGAVRAALWTQGRPAGLYSMMDVTGMTESR
jgi:4-hydroxy-tetrahydrodipicolinate reductase